MDYCAILTCANFRPCLEHDEQNFQNVVTATLRGSAHTHLCNELLAAVVKLRHSSTGSILGESCGFTWPLSEAEKIGLLPEIVSLFDAFGWILTRVVKDSKEARPLAFQHGMSWQKYRRRLFSNTQNGPYGRQQRVMQTLFRSLLKIPKDVAMQLLSMFQQLLEKFESNKKWFWVVCNSLCNVTWREAKSLETVLPCLLCISSAKMCGYAISQYFSLSDAERDAGKCSVDEIASRTFEGNGINILLKKLRKVPVEKFNAFWDRGMCSVENGYCAYHQNTRLQTLSSD